MILWHLVFNYPYQKSLVLRDNLRKILLLLNLKSKVQTYLWKIFLKYNDLKKRKWDQPLFYRIEFQYR